jgi:hypothetical protein
LRQALVDLDYQVVQAAQVRDYHGASRKADLVAKTRGSYDIGFTRPRAGAPYDIIADWWGLQTSIGLDQQQFVNQVNQRYAYNKVVTEVKARGFTITEEQLQPDQSIRVVVRRWAVGA